MDIYSQDFIKSINPGTKVKYRTANRTLVNNTMFIVAQVLNQSLDKYIIDYEDDVFDHDFFKEIGFDSKYRTEDDILKVSITDYDKATDIGLDHLKIIQKHLKKHCIGIIRSKKDLIKDINTKTIYDLYNDGNCLPDKYKNLKDKLCNSLEYGKSNTSIGVSMKKLLVPFGIPLTKEFLEKELAYYRFYKSDAFISDIENVRRKLKEYEDLTFNPLEFLCHNLDLMAEHLLGYCYQEINQLNMVRKKNNQQGQQSAQQPATVDDDQNIFANAYFPAPPNTGQPVPLVQTAQQLVDNLNATLANCIANKKSLGQ